MNIFFESFSSNKTFFCASNERYKLCVAFEIASSTFFFIKNNLKIKNSIF